MNNSGDKLLEAIKSKDVQLAITEVRQFNASMCDVTVGANYVAWITAPANLTSVHKALVEDLNIPPRLLAIRRMLMSRPQKAALLIKSMEKALERFLPK